MKSSEIFDPFPAVKKNRLNLLPENPEKNDASQTVGPGRFPSWLHRPIPKGGGMALTGQAIAKNRLHTVCEEAKCPNLPECWSKKTATYLVMGKECTRACGFCDIDFTKKPLSLDADEPKRVAESVLELGLKHVVITMVARDDLLDGGASHLAAVVQEVRTINPATTIELLTSDFLGRIESLDTVLAVQPEIFNHNIETTRRLTPKVRHTATYDRTLSVLKWAKNTQYHPFVLVKSGLMVGLGESEEEVQNTLIDLKQSGCDIVTIGQYLQPDRHKLRVKEFITPEMFKRYEDYGRSIGIPNMYCGPFVRSSYNANLVFKNAQNQTKIINSQ